MIDSLLEVLKNESLIEKSRLTTLQNNKKQIQSYKLQIELLKKLPK